MKVFVRVVNGVFSKLGMREELKEALDNEICCLLAMVCPSFSSGWSSWCICLWQ